MRLNMTQNNEQADLIETTKSSKHAELSSYQYMVKHYILEIYIAIFILTSVLSIFLYSEFGDHEAKTPIEHIQGYYLGHNIKDYSELVSFYDDSDRDGPRLWQIHEVPFNKSKPDRGISIYSASTNNLIYKIIYTLSFESKDACLASHDKMLESLHENYKNRAFTSGILYQKDGKTIDVDECKYRGYINGGYIIDLTLEDKSIQDNVNNRLRKQRNKAQKEEIDNASNFIDEALIDKNKEG